MASATRGRVCSRAGCGCGFSTWPDRAVELARCIFSRLFPFPRKFRELNPHSFFSNGTLDDTFNGDAVVSKTKFQMNVRPNRKNIGVQNKHAI